MAAQYGLFAQSQERAYGRVMMVVVKDIVSTSRSCLQDGLLHDRPVYMQ